MTSFQDKETIQPPPKKNRWWPFVLLIFLLSGLLIGGFLLFDKDQGSLSDSPTKNTGTTQSPVLEQAVKTGPSTKEESTNENTVAVPENNSPVQNNPGNTTSGGESTPPFIPTSPVAGTSTTPQSGTPTTTPTTMPTTTPTTTPTTSTEPPVPPQTQSIYTYRAATAGDDFSASYTNSGNDIVITGVQTSASVYTIPSYIDGKRVIAITANAFYGSGAQIIYLPATVKTVRNYAFNGCPLSDIYFTHNIYIENMAFYGNTASLTIHCPSSCQDRNLRTYKSSAAYYGAVWEEWNG